ncbi:S-adenosyl-L-methionine-dependent methyltransferase [Trematosphaeria pertusa]|uniref:S-adenosyl-L-methionine-dependent methyltransferase n=1 Tax=Trematosphaeria pertusa TaxID=390896 RepID=A0A6A6HSB3_9PLEO|nr:S-adenosyl-L-methionine-dependent methyltransferase [Trematosphaeria pertusa]KAF2240320.1 S-adenosyl-L-methionine-dependent methyltransferase [Trematosphaeria pertusa]
MPCDQPEQDRLALQHQVYLLALKGKLTTTRITSATRRILDLGTGPGYWAVAMAQQYPHAEVVGVDMAVWDIETTEAVAPNARVTWEIDDLDVWGVEPELDDVTLRLERYNPYRDHANREPLDSPAKQKTKASDSQTHTQPHTPSDPSFDLYSLEPEVQPGWHFSDTFDLIHMRSMKGVFAYWEGVYDEIYKNLSPGGWVEIADYDMTMPSLEEMAGIEEFPFPALRKLYLGVMQASFKSGRPIGTYYMHPTYLEDAGFKDVQTTYVNVPIGQWPEDEEQRKIGKLFLVSVMEMLEANLLRLLTVWGDAEKIWSVEEVKDEIERGKKEILEWSRGPDRQGKTEGWCASFKWIVGRKSKNA